MRRRLTLFDAANYGFFVVLGLAMVYPFWYSLVASFMTEGEYLSNRYILITTHPTLDAYKRIFEHGEIFVRLRVTTLITVIGTGVSLFLTAFSAYGFSKTFPGSRVLIYFVVATMFVYPGLIPNYLNLKSLGLINRIQVMTFQCRFISFRESKVNGFFVEYFSPIVQLNNFTGCFTFSKTWDIETVSHFMISLINGFLKIFRTDRDPK